MDRRIYSVSDLVNLAGGTAALAARLGCARTTVLDWERTGKVPGTRLLQIWRTFDLIPAADLLPLSAPPRRRRRRLVDA